MSQVELGEEGQDSGYSGLRWGLKEAEEDVRTSLEGLDGRRDCFLSY